MRAREEFRMSQMYDLYHDAVGMVFSFPEGFIWGSGIR